MITKDQEIELVYQVITHPAGFILDLFGGMLCIRSYFVEVGTEWEVTWEEILDGGKVVDSFRQFLDAKEAATFFVEKRYDMQLGIDMEI